MNLFHLTLASASHVQLEMDRLYPVRWTDYIRCQKAQPCQNYELHTILSKTPQLSLFCTTLVLLPARVSSNPARTP
jgi:hypothetical protein